MVWSSQCVRAAEAVSQGSVPTSTEHAHTLRFLATKEKQPWRFLFLRSISVRRFCEHHFLLPPLPSLREFTCNEQRIRAEHIREHLPGQWLGMSSSDGHNVKWWGVRLQGPIIFFLKNITQLANLTIQSLFYSSSKNCWTRLTNWGRKKKNWQQDKMWRLLFKSHTDSII